MTLLYSPHEGIDHCGFLNHVFDVVQSEDVSDFPQVAKKCGGRRDLDNGLLFAHITMVREFYSAHIMPLVRR